MGARSTSLQVISFLWVSLSQSLCAAEESECRPPFQTSEAPLKKFLRSKRTALKMCHNEKSLPSLSNERNTLFFFFPNNDGDRTRIIEPQDSLHQGKDSCLQPLAIITPETHFKAATHQTETFEWNSAKEKEKRGVCGELRLQCLWRDSTNKNIYSTVLSSCVSVQYSNIFTEAAPC